ncbi:MAG: DUF1697 domain-containing protein [Paracoccaceae bacterium]|nr:DUF1697 domain-containing protein [Paracoccaceae bacterium]MDG1739411.1 DUF1697 domain-containing protein [Paracoccaceae bacterium]MDG2258671.1 DUF1697 domain-containing protein [Paracoccaceae bacterium]
MPKYAALLRAVNVGGTGKLPMSDLREMCERLGLEAPKTILASGNVVFQSSQAPSEIRNALEIALAEYAGKPVGVFIYDEMQMQIIHDEHPFPEHPASQCGILFTDQMPTPEEMAKPKGLNDEVIEAGSMVIYVKFPNGMGQSKLKTPGADHGTMRNFNTVAKLLNLLKE